MPKETRKDIDQLSSLRFLSRRELPRTLERNAMAVLKKDVEREEREEAERERELDRLTTKLRAPLLDVLGQDRRVAQGKKDLLAFYRNWKNFKPVVPTARKEKSRVTSGSITLTVAPPYNLEWGYVDINGPAWVGHDAQPSTGYLYSDIKCDADDVSWGFVIPYVGIYFLPPTWGLLTVSSTPSLIYFWGTWSYYGTCRSRGSVGLRVYRFKLNGTPDPSVSIANTDTVLWNDESWWPSGAGPHSGSWSGTLSLAFNVDASHFYHLGVYFRTSARAPGEGLTYAGAARAEMNGFVPSMSTTLKLG